MSSYRMAGPWLVSLNMRLMMSFASTLEGLRPGLCRASKRAKTSGADLKHPRDKALWGYLDQD